MDHEKTIEFLLDQQAKMFAGIEELRAGIEELRGGIEELRGGIEELRGGMKEFREQQAQINVSLGRAMLGLTENMDKLAAAQTEGAERLNALIVVVDGLVRRSQQ